MSVCAHHNAGRRLTFLLTPYTVVWPYKNWGTVWHLWQTHNSYPPNLWEQEVLWREYRCYNGPYLLATTSWFKIWLLRCLLELFREHTPTITITCSCFTSCNLPFKQAAYGPHLHTSFLEKKPSPSPCVKKRRRQRWSANVARTFERSVFNEIHTMHVLSSSWKA